MMCFQRYLNSYLHFDIIKLREKSMPINTIFLDIKIKCILIKAKKVGTKIAMNIFNSWKNSLTLQYSCFSNKKAPSAKTVLIVTPQ
jgi:hypothetical protein